MEIYNKSTNTSYFSKVKNKIRVKRTISILLIVFILIGFGFGCVIYGAYLNKTGQTTTLKMFLVRISELDFSFFSKNIESKTIVIDNFSIDVKFKNWERIRYYRELALSNGGITSEMQKEVPAKIKYNGHTYSVDISLTGQTNSHLNHPNKWSLSVKVKKNEAIMGMRRFAFLFPQARGYLTDWIATEMLKSQNVIGLRSDFVNVSINGKDNGLYYLEERFDKRLIEHNRFREGIVFKLNNTDLKIYGLKKIAKSEEFSSQLILLKRLIHGFLTGEIKTDKVFDLEKFATLYVVSDILNQKHPVFRSNMRLYFNPITSLIEPISREWGYLRKETKAKISLSIEKPNPEVEYHVSLSKEPILKKIINSFAFEEEYIKQAVILSNPSYIDSIVKENENTINELLDKIYRQNPFYIFPLDMLHENQNYIWDKIFTKQQSINVFYKFIKEDSIFLSVENKLDLPIEIHYFKYNSKTEIIPTNRILLKSNYKTQKINQSINFRLNSEINSTSFSSDSLEVYYSILGVNQLKKAIVYPKEMTKSDYLILNPTTQPSNVNDFPFIYVNNENNTIEFPAEKCNISMDLIIPEGYFVRAKPGCQINLSNSARIISYSPILFFGKSDSVITITSSDSTGQGIVVFNCDMTSEFSYVNFKYLSNISDFGWDLRGAITFYESPVNINNCTFYGNIKGDDYLNIIRTDFNILNTTFENTKADAFDSDFCTGKIENVKFRQVGNDAIDVSGTKLYINGVEIVNSGDKGISGGEKSHLICKNIEISGGEIAIASKDNTIIDVNGINITSTKLAYCAFQKKPEYGPGIINVNNANLKNVDVDHLIEVGSSLSINGKQIDQKSNKVKEVLYGAEYGKSSK